MPPIRPEHRKHYNRASGWPELRLKILDRAKGRCERCGVKNHTYGHRDDNTGAWHAVDEQQIEGLTHDGVRVVRIVLTVAHLDQDGHTGARDESRLAALCQRCHNLLDAGQRAVNASRTRALKREAPGQQSLFGEAR